MLTIDEEKSWEEHAKLAEAYRKIGSTKIYLHHADDYPWQFVDSVEPGGSHRLEISTDVRFTAKHPSGLTFSWSFDIEPANANGKGGYHIDVEAIQRVLIKLPMKPATEFVKYLKACAEAVEKKANEYQQEAQRQYGAANALRNATVAKV